MKFVLITIFTLAGVLGTLFADIFLKKSNSSDWRFITVGIVLYALVAIPVAFAFKHTEFGSYIIIWEAALLILSMIAATWYFHEPFTAYRLIAVLFAMVAIVLAYK